MSLYDRDVALINKTNAAPAVQHPNDVAKDAETDVRPLESVLAAHAALVAKLAQLKPKEIRGDADDLDLDLRAEHMTAIAAAVDQYFLELGRDTKFRTHANIDLEPITDAVTEAIDGYLGEMERAAEQWVEDNGQFGVGA